MHIKTEGTAQVRHSETGQIFEIEPDELDWEVVSGHERGMGPEYLWAAKTSRDGLGDLRWEISEYPIGAFGDPTSHLDGHELVQDFIFSVEHEPDDPSEEIDDHENGSEPFDRVAAADEMEEWFRENYEDPANSLPYESREGGYQWIYGGPETPLDALQDGFAEQFPLDLIEEVATRITAKSGIWDWTPIPDSDFYNEVELEEIDENDADKLSRLMPISEELVQNPDSGIFSVRHKEVSEPSLFAATLAQLADAIEDVLENPSNGLNVDSLDIRKLRRTLERYANDPQRVEMDLTTVHHSLTIQIGSGELPPSDENQALLSALQEGAQGIRATDPVVAENRRILRDQALRELSPNALSQIAEAAPVLEAITEGHLREQMHEDILFLTKEMRTAPSRLPGVTRADAIMPGHDEAVRVFGRSARILIALRRVPEFFSRLHDSPTFKSATILSTLVDLIKIGLALFQ
tara:strand:- start:243 stop:1634 length:1392 start_codon:yes stop_codon:yes gene_type:complete